MTLASFKRQVQAGTVLRCIENTYRPTLNGTLRTVLKAGPSVCTVETDGVRNFRMEWPAARDVVYVDDCQITYRIGREKLHQVTLAIVHAAEV